MSRCRLWHTHGQPDKQAEARATLAEVYGWFSEGWRTRDLEQARSLLDAT
jgi:hypothetical protein